MDAHTAIASNLLNSLLLAFGERESEREGERKRKKKKAC